MSPENSKPEWFQMAEADTFPPQSKGKRAIRIMALATPLLVLGAGLVFAQSQDSPVAVASPTSSASSSATDPIALSSTPSAVTPQASTPAPTPVATQASTSVATQASTPASTPTSSTIQVSQVSPASPSLSISKPAIASMPTGGGEDDGLESGNDD